MGPHGAQAKMVYLAKLPFINIAAVEWCIQEQ